jgi:glycosylphosphatidylinositol transamidase (GPIT) subunit GPI8
MHGSAIRSNKVDFSSYELTIESLIRNLDEVCSNEIAQECKIRDFSKRKRGLQV